MCGIVGMTCPDGDVTADTALALARLEYRGYDSYGVASRVDESLVVSKDTGSIGRALQAGLAARLPQSSVALAHTRWATHGGVTSANAHPHLSNDGRVAIVHNGVIKNHAALRRQLEASGITMASSTDSEVVAHLIAAALRDGASTHDAIAAATTALVGEYALAVLVVDDPNTVWGAKRKSPLLATSDGKRGMLASDQMALPNGKAIVLEDGDIVAVRAAGVEVFTTSADGALTPIERDVTQFGAGPATTELGEYPHWMIKEIHETSDAVSNALLTPAEDLATVLDTDRTVRLIGSGSAYYVASMGAYMLTELAEIDAVAMPSDEAPYLTHFRPNDPLIAVSQSGETFDTLEVCRAAVDAGAVLTSICNVPFSTQERMASHRIQQRSGPEICVLSTKSIVSQVVLLARLALETGVRKGTLDDNRYQEHMESLERLPSTLARLIDERATLVQSIAAKYSRVNDWFFLGRGILYPAACESALKFKEVNYHHAEGSAAGMLKHGMISLIHPGFHTVALLPSAEGSGDRYAATLAAISEIAARSGPVIALGPDDAPEDDRSDCVEYLGLPYHGELVADLVVQLVAGQLLSYYCAVDLGRGDEIDKPRALAKSVTVA
ncbi:glutamine--fructose-6-phosphate transaminase (isomerizing) [Nocardia asteroides]|uniref:glutamine--fructose-6-phosphate transaminase (isomerizing) n=1 Tax=Nocardia asteroides TaxID=1824 RepID=UPI0037C57064